jgi:hypothetical protein
MAAIQPSNNERAWLYNRFVVTPVKNLHADGSITVPDPSGTQVLPPSPQRAALWALSKVNALKYLYPDGSVWEGNGDSNDSANNGLPVGGLTGQILVKASDADGDVVWLDAPEGSARSLTDTEFNAAFQL